MKVTVTGIPEATRAFARVQPTAHRGLGALTRRSAEVAARVASATAPRRTGLLASSITVIGDGLTWRAGVSSAAPYGVPVEYGTVYTPARPFMRVGAEAAETETQRSTAQLAAALPEMVR